MIWWRILGVARGKRRIRQCARRDERRKRDRGVGLRDSQARPNGDCRVNRLRPRHWPLPPRLHHTPTRGDDHPDDNSPEPNTHSLLLLVLGQGYSPNLTGR